MSRAASATGHYIGGATISGARVPSSAGPGALDMHRDGVHLERHHLKTQCVRGVVYIEIIHIGHLERHLPNRTARTTRRQ